MEKLLFIKERIEACVELEKSRLHMINKDIQDYEERMDMDARQYTEEYEEFIKLHDQE